MLDRCTSSLSFTHRLLEKWWCMLDQCTSSLSFTQRLFGEMMMYFGSMYIQLTIRLMQQTTQAWWHGLNSWQSLVFQFLWCSQTGDHPQEDLAKFGYKPYLKVENFKNPFIFLTTRWNLLLKSGELNFISLLKPGKMRAIFSSKILRMCQNRIFQVKIMQKFKNLADPQGS